MCRFEQHVRGAVSGPTTSAALAAAATVRDYDQSGEAQALARCATDMLIKALGLTVPRLPTHAYIIYPTCCVHQFKSKRTAATSSDALLGGCRIPPRFADGVQKAGVGAAGADAAVKWQRDRPVTALLFLFLIQRFTAAHRWGIRAVSCRARELYITCIDCTRVLF